MLVVRRRLVPTSLHFDPSAWSKGAYTELALQTLFDWRTHISLGGIHAPRKYADLKEPTEFEEQFSRNLSNLVPIATKIVERVRKPRDLLGNWLLLERPGNDFKRGMTLGLAGKKLFAWWSIQRVVRYRDEFQAPWKEVERRHAEVALDLLHDEKRFHDFADLLILRSRAAILPGEHTLSKRRTLGFQIRVRGISSRTPARRTQMTHRGRILPPRAARESDLPETAVWPVEPGVHLLRRLRRR